MLLFELLYKTGNDFFKKKNYNISKILYWLCIFDKTLKEDCIIMLTAVYKKCHKYNKAIKLLKKELKKEETYDLRFQLAHIYSFTNNEESMVIYEELLNKMILLQKPIDIDYQLIASLVEVYNRTKYYDKALNLIKQFVEGKEIVNEEYLFFNVGNTFLELKEYDKAISYYKKYLDENDPHDHGVIYNLAFCYSKKEDYDKSLYYYNESLKYIKEEYNIGWTLYAIGCDYSQMNKLDKAKDYFKKAIEKGYLKAKDALKEISQN